MSAPVGCYLRDQVVLSVQHVALSQQYACLQDHGHEWQDDLCFHFRVSFSLGFRIDQIPNLRPCPDHPVGWADPRGVVRVSLSMPMVRRLVAARQRAVQAGSLGVPHMGI